jgi:hypothetical protein
VADAIDIPAVERLIRSTVKARLAPKPTTPPYVQYQQPPIAIDGASLDLPGIDGFQARFKVFDYGVISVALTRSLPTTWRALLEHGLGWYENPGLSAAAERFCRTLLQRLAPALTHPRSDWLTEDYLVFALKPTAASPTADAVLAEHGAELAQLLRGERSAVSADERDEVLRHRISYFANDLVIPTWNAAFILDEDAGTQASSRSSSSPTRNCWSSGTTTSGSTSSSRACTRSCRGRMAQTWFGRRYARAARQIHSLFIDVNELTDKTENALKIAGDVYAARVFALVAARLALEHWKASVREKAADGR